MRKSPLFIIIIFSFTVTRLCANYHPTLQEDDVYFEKADTGYDLFIRKIPEVNSILLTESPRGDDPKFTNYGLRTEKYYEANSDEIRILDKKILHTKYEAYFLVDSTPQKHPLLGEAFHFFLPEKVIYGYEWTKRGEIKILPGMRINVRMFQKPYSDYSGAFQDQWIYLNYRLSQSTHRQGLITYMKRIVPPTKGKVRVRIKKEKLEDVFTTFIPENVNVSPTCDLIFIIDTTISMKEAFPVFVSIYPQLVKQIHKKIKKLRVGFIFYRDYGDEFITKRYDLSEDIEKTEEILKKMTVKGGQDVPEALNEAIYELQYFDYQAEKKIAFIVTDAPAHPIPRKEITEEMALKVVKNYNIKLNAICLPYK